MDEEQALIESHANSRHEIAMSKSISHLNNLRTTTATTTTTTTTQAATSTKAKNCRGLIQKRAHTLDDFMEGNPIGGIKRRCHITAFDRKRRAQNCV